MSNGELEKAMAEEMMYGAVAYMKKAKFDMNDEAKFRAILDAIRRDAPQAIKEALRDAKDAFDAHMDRVGVATALATMRLAGIKAAKEVLG